ncbi:MAG: alpha-L-fucosidase [Bacteroidota bacterium]
MKSNLLLPFFLFSWSIVVCQKVSAPQPYGLLPSERQLAWQKTGFYAILHFTPTTFENKEWGYGDADPSIFNPTSFDANQILSAVKAAGMKGIILVCKHHDGFCLWPTKTTGYNISKSPWKGGKGDMVREFRDACDRAGIKFGAYVSPWDRNNPEYGTKAYVDLYREQLYEIYTLYGGLFMSWHDGSNGGDGYYGGKRETRLINRATYYPWDSLWSMTRRLQPGACIFSDIGWDVRWVGNESGFAGETCWATFTPKGREVDTLAGIGDTRYWEGVEGHRNGKYWMPAECDVPLRSGWFYHPGGDSTVKSPAMLFDLYCKSVGRGQCLDLGLCPDTHGLLHEKDVASLEGFGKLLKSTFADNLAKKGKIRLSNVRGGDSKNYGAENLVDDDPYSYWATDDSVTTPSLILEMKMPVIFKIITIRENIKLGQRIGQVALDIRENDQWKEIAGATSIGALRIIRLTSAQTAAKIRMRVVRSAAPPCISEFGIYGNNTP